MGTPNDAAVMGDTTIRVSEELAEELYQRKGRGSSYEDYLWELLEVVDQHKEGEDIAESNSSENAVVEANETGIEAKEDVYHAVEEQDEAEEEETQSAEAQLRDLDLPGSGSNYEARVNAVATFYEYLRDHPRERVSKSDLQELAEKRDLDVGYSSFTSLWNNWVKSNTSQGRDVNTLAQLPGVEMDGDDYIYTGVVDSEP